MNNSSVIKPSISNGTSPHFTRAPAFGKMEWIFGLLLTHSVFGLFIVVSNVVVLITFFRYARLRTTTNVVLMSMALADLGVGLVMIPLWLRAINAHYYSGTPFSKTEQRVFEAYPLMDQALILTSIYHLVYLHCLRSYSIVFPIRHRKMSNRPVLIAILIIWAVSVAFPPFTKKVITSRFCEDCFVYISLASNVGIPLVIVSVANFLLWRRVAKSFRQHQKKDTKALVTIAILIGLFCVCFIPIFVASTIEQVAKVYIDEKVVVVLKFLHFSNSGLNPVVYAWRNPELARAIKKLLYWQPTREANTSVTALERGREKRMTPSTIS